MTDGPSKKRGAVRQITKDDDPNAEEDSAPVEFGNFKKASEEVLATRRIVKVKRTPPTPTSSNNPFASIQLVPPPPAQAEPANIPGNIPAVENGQEDTDKPEVENPATEQPDVEDPVVQEKQSDNPVVEDPAEEKPSGKATMTFQQVSSGTNAFGNFGTGFSSSTFSFGTASSFSFGSTSASASSFGFGSSGAKPGEGFSLFSNAEPGGGGGGGASSTPAPENYATVSLQEVQTETGEEKEKPAFTGDATLYEFVDKSWKERGKGEIKLNVSEDQGNKARLVMRSKGNLRLLMNASVYPDMPLSKMDNKSVTFACINSASGNSTGLTTYAIKLRDASKLVDFIRLVECHSGKAENLPENAQEKPAEFNPQS